MKPKQDIKDIKPDAQLKACIKEISTLRHLKSNLEFNIGLVNELLDIAENKKRDIVGETKE